MFILILNIRQILALTLSNFISNCWLAIHLFCWINSDSNAHHNFRLYYDSSKIVVITGIVKKYSYISLNIEIDLEVKKGNKNIL